MNEPHIPDAKPDDFEGRISYFVSKLIVLWRDDKENAYVWLMGREKVLRLFLLTVLLALSEDRETVPGLRIECKHFIEYFKAKRA